MLDALLMLFPGAILRVLLGVSSTGFDDLDAPNGWLAPVLQLGLDALYATVLMSSRAGATLGMQVMGLRIVTVDGRPVSFGRALGRYLALVFTFLTFGIGYLIQVFTRRRQTLHDLIAGTMVVRLRPETGPVADPLANL